MENIENKIDADLKFLKNKWFLIKNKEKAKWYLKNVWLHRLRRYFNMAQWNYKDFDFSKIIDAYIFDKELRMLNLQLIEVIEKRLKTALISFVPDYLNRDDYYNTNNQNYKKEISKIDNRLIYNEKKVIDLKFKDIECKNFYNSNWFLNPELFYDKLSFWEIINIFRDLNFYKKWLIASEFSIDIQKLEQWFMCILDLRNLCSHSWNIFNRKFTKKILSRDIWNIIWNIELNSYLWYFLLLSIFNIKIIPEYHWQNRVFSLIEKYNIDFKLFQIKKETSHIEHENSEAWEVLVEKVYHNL